MYFFATKLQRVIDNWEGVCRVHADNLTFVMAIWRILGCIRQYRATTFMLRGVSEVNSLAKKITHPGSFFSTPVHFNGDPILSPFIDIRELVWPRLASPRLDER